MSRLARWTGTGLLVCAFSISSAAATGWQHIGNVQRIEKLKDGVELTAGSAKVRITAFRDGVIRVRLAPQGSFPKDFSWAVIESPEPPAISIEDGKSDVRMTVGRLIVIVNKAPLLVTFADSAGQVLLADEPSLPMAWNGSYIHSWKRMPAEESYFGLGDKPGPLNHRNRAYTMWNTDFFGWQESDDPLYKTIPFFIGLCKGTAYGVFFDNTYRSSFDFGKESPDYFSFRGGGRRTQLLFHCRS